MDLLNDILRNPVEPEYRSVAARGGPPPKGSRGALLVVALLIGALFTVSAVQTTRSAPAAGREREQLIRQVRAADERQDELRTRLEQLKADNERVSAVLVSDSEEALAAQEQADRLAPATGEVGVTGPGIVVVVDDAPALREDKLNRVLDKDLQVLVNGLWSSGAEAVAINGHRVSPLTAIRSAGDAITVNYRSLTRPYQVEAIGSPQTLAARFADSSGGQLWQGLAQNYQMRFDITQSEELELDADPSLGLRHGRRTG